MDIIRFYSLMWENLGGDYEKMPIGIKIECGSMTNSNIKELKTIINDEHVNVDVTNYVNTDFLMN